MYLLYGGCPSSSEFVLYDWGLNVGDTMTVYPYNFNGGPAIVDSVYLITMLKSKRI
jgi:hypothetical protein